ncbi:MAG TPA: hypothetical protein PK400_05550 [Phycisphaerales bacterium]|nr:hypothetical protein [Phycisphaerales bacterium]HRQ75965.1 hypothetical protein [Phycisphaerales bacterium]
MPMTPEQIRTALADLNGQRAVRVHFDHADDCKVQGALLVPMEADNIVKLTDGQREYLLDAERIAWIEIG